MDFVYRFIGTSIMSVLEHRMTEPSQALFHLKGQEREMIFLLIYSVLEKSKGFKFLDFCQQ
jgi:hypothetical protein